ncbi:MAG: glycosyltransferase [Acidobacteriota bacterium]
MRDFTPRVAFFTDSFHEANGVARTSREFASYARSAFFPFLAVHPGPKAAHLRRGQYEEIELASSRRILRLEHDLTFDLLFPRHLNSLQRKVAAFEPDVIHVTGPGHVGLLGAMVAYRLGVPLVASWHTNVHEYGARRLSKVLANMPASWTGGLVRQAEARSLDLTVRFYRLARLLFAPNPELTTMLAERTGRTVHPMERGIDCDLFSPVRREPGSRPFTIGYVGRLSVEKKVRLLVDLDVALRAAGLANYRFLIVGDGSERNWLMEHLPEAQFPGLLRGEALSAAYANMDAFVFPSETDTYGNVVQEAMASGVPCIVSACGGPQYLIDPSMGFVAPDVENVRRRGVGPGTRPGASYTYAECGPRGRAGPQLVGGVQQDVPGISRRLPGRGLTGGREVHCHGPRF